MQAKDLIVLGSSRLLGKLYCGDIDIGGNASISTISSALSLTNTTDSSSTTTGSLKVSGGVGIAKKLYVGGNTYHSGATYFGSTYNISSSGQATLSQVKVGTGSGDTTITNNSATIANINSSTITNSGNISNKNGIIETDEIQSNVWNIVSTQNLGGDFFVAPTIMVTEGSTFYINSISNGVIAGYIVDSTNITSDSFAGHSWTSGSKIKLTGKITKDSNSYILGTCDGTLTANMNSSSGRITFSVTCKSATLPTATGSYTISDGTVMMYSVGGTNKVGIYMTSYGIDHSDYNANNANKRNKYSYIDIFNGSDGSNPKVRIGKLNGLPAINSISPEGYGIYTTNGYFEGKVVANGGKIGGWTIGDGYITSNSNRTTYNATTVGITINKDGIGAGNGSINTFYLKHSDGSMMVKKGSIANFTIDGSKLYSNSHSAYNTAKTGIYIGDDYISFGSGGVTYFNTSGTGKIGPWTLTTTAFYNTKTSYNNSNAGVYIGTDYIAGGAGEKWWLKSDGSAKIGAMTLSSAGVLAVPAANISGTLTASQVDVSGIITAGSIVTNTLTGGTFNTTDYIRVSTQASSSLTIGTSGAKTDWRIIAGKTFGVDKSGNLYATSANIAGALTATSLTINSGASISGDGANQILNSDIEIGGTNILADSKNLSAWKKESGVTVSWDATKEAYKITVTKEASNTSRYGIYQDLVIDPDSIYTISNYMFSDSGAQCFLGLHMYEAGATHNWPSDVQTTATVKKRYSKTKTASSTQVECRVYMGMQLNGTATTYVGYFSLPKLEKGNKATDWSPAIEDIEKTQFSVPVSRFKNEASSHSTITVDGDNITVTRITSGSTVFGCYYDFLCKPNTFYSVSLSVLSDTGYKIYFGGNYGTSDVWTELGVSHRRTTNNKWYAATGKATSATQTYLRIYIGSNVQNASITFTDVVIYEGNAIGLLDKSAYDASKVATNCITEISNAGIWVTPSEKKPNASGAAVSGTTTGTLINADGVGIYKDGTKLAEYGATTKWYSPNGQYLAAKIENNATYGSLMTINHLVVSTSTSPSVNDLWIHPSGISTTRSYEDGSTWVESIMGINGGKISMDSHKSDASGLVGTISIEPGRILARSYENSPVEANIRVASAAGSIYMYSQSTSSGNRGIYAIDSSDTYHAVVDIPQGTTCYFRGVVTPTSDLKKKDVIEGYDWKVDDFINGLKPIAFRRIHEDGTLGDRICMGFGAQDVRELTRSLYDEELSLYQAKVIDDTKGGTERESFDYHGEDIDDKKLSWSLAYDELIAPMVLEIQRLMARVDKLEADLKKNINKIFVQSSSRH